MEMSSAVTLLEVVLQDVSRADQPTVVAALTASRRLRSLLDARDLACHDRLNQVSSFPEDAAAKASKTTLRDAARKIERAKTVAAVPALGGALTAGAITGEHIDEYGKAAKALPAAARERLAAQASRLATIGEQNSFDDYAHAVRQAALAAQDDDGTERLQRQRHTTRLRTWIDRTDGMFCLHGRFDPLTGLTLAHQLANTVAARDADKVPDLCPTDPGEKQDFLRALALLALLNGQGAEAGRPEFIVVLDERQRADGTTPAPDFGIDVDLPDSTVTEMRSRATVRTVIVRDGVVDDPEGKLDLGRSTRLANRNQRRALQGLYSTCAIPGCTVGFGHTSIHHVIWWENGGRTDLENLLPLCSRCHTRVHENGWQLTVTRNRELTIHYPDGNVQTTGPPQRRTAR